MQYRLYTLGTVTWSSGGVSVLPLAALPERIGGNPAYVEGIQLYGTVTVTVTANSVQPRDLVSILSRVVLHDGTQPRVAVRGQGMRRLATIMRGYDPCIGNQSALSATGSRHIYLPIDFTDRWAASPSDGAELARALRGGSLEVQWAPDTVYGAGRTVTACTLRVAAVLAVRDEIRMPSMVRIREVSSGDNPLVLAGDTWTHVLLAQAPDGTDITSAAVTMVDLSTDRSGAIHAGVTPGEVMRRWAESRPMGPVGAVGEDGVGSPDGVPLIWPAGSGKVTQAPSGALALRYTGSATSAYLIAREIVGYDPAAVVSYAQRLGLPNPEQWTERARPKAVTKAGLRSAAKARVLPVKFEG